MHILDHIINLCCGVSITSLVPPLAGCDDDDGLAHVGLLSLYQAG